MIDNLIQDYLRDSLLLWLSFSPNYILIGQSPNHLRISKQSLFFTATSGEIVIGLMSNQWTVDIEKEYQTHEVKLNINNEKLDF